MVLEILELAGGLAEFLFWFQLTGSCVVWVVTLGSVWIEDDHPWWAVLVGFMLHVAIIAVVLCFWGSGSEEKEKGKEGGGQAKPVAQAKATH